MKKWMIFMFALLLVLPFQMTTYAAVDETELQNYLSTIGMEKEELVDYLASYDFTLADFENVSELRDFLGDPMTPENLVALLQEFDMTYEELKALLIEYGEMEENEKIEDVFPFISDVEDFILFEQGIGEMDEEMLAEMDELFSMLDLNEEEITRFFEHIARVIEADPTVLDQLMTVAEKMMQFEEFETATELTAEQISEIMSIFNEITDLLQLDFKFYLVENGVKTPISMAALMKLEDAKGASLFIEVYDLNGNLLLDLNLTPDMIGSEIITETGKDIQKAAEKIAPVSHTVKGAKMPETAGNYALQLLFGVMLMSASFLFIKKAGVLK
jgi:processed acidic surface protein